MPGSSLWLLPPEDSEVFKAIHDLIANQIPAIYPKASPPHFVPHVTLTSDILAEHSEPQRWLDGIDLPDSVGKLKVAIGEVKAGGIFTQKLTMRCEKNDEICDLAMYCRAAGVEGAGMEGARKWVEGSYGPHCSLMYSDIPEKDVQVKLDEVAQKVKGARERYSGCETAKGAVIWLVPTAKSIEDWKPIATRKLRDVVWEWRT